MALLSVEFIINVIKLWKNGVAQNLTDESNSVSIRSVFVAGNDVYVAGHESNEEKTIAKLWKNGRAQNYTDGTNHAGDYSVYVSDNNALNPH